MRHNEDKIRQLRKGVWDDKNANERSRREIHILYQKNAELRLRLGEAEQYSSKGKVIIQGIPTSERNTVKGFA